MATNTHVFSAISVGPFVSTTAKNNAPVRASTSGLAIAASAAEDDVADDRNVVEPGDGFAAPDAVRSRLDDAAVARPAVDADVEEAADQQTEQQGEYRFNH
jgi:hypothetical protein